MAPLLKIENLVTSFYIEEGKVESVRSVNLEIARGETVALVGESGCGKSVTALSVMRLVPTPPGRYESGRILFDNREIFKLTEEEMRGIRGNDISMIFQEPMTSLNPIFTIGDQIVEAIVLHQNKTEAEARQLAIELLDRVRIPSAAQRIDQYPHELSGGMKQRVMIAMSISCRPALLIADEPTTALDVTIEAQILDVLANLRDETQMSILLITHNLGIVAQFADRVAVMYAGKIVEEAPVVELFEDPKHPYTRGLLRSLPKDEPGKPLETIAGTVPNPVNLPSGCAFHPRCPDVMDECSREIPPVYRTGPNQTAACYLYKTNAVAQES
ncbi:ABC transporter ATP-binding protein [Nitrospina gracilis]|uniref:ABC transporter ATP-binding protein n=1 Tax=Nitrospina gracilis TaxID=35801 RepID=UPI001F1A737C|nr:ABC transporter ATP-binding protein [Nitrospina gracilis]MCF8720938.1 peptide/nickel transport system ATP-binding protein/oligopeptide transport system ATP-binding protein [Nitrospina gracilis Nb-211]